MPYRPLLIPPKLPKGEDGYRLLTIRVKEHTLERAEHLSDRTGRSRNEIIGRLLEYALDSAEDESTV